MGCPLCHHERARPSWVGSTFYRGREFAYVECLSCRSFYCDPMPDTETLAQMYGPDYATSFQEDPGIDDPKEALRVVRWLQQGTGEGTFVDYGCGKGTLLVEAAKVNWQAVGVEFDAEVAKAVEQRTGARVVSRPAELADGVADVLHLGDVIEHLTEVDLLMPEILRLVKPGGLLLAQGPLENNTTLYTLVLRLTTFVRGARRIEMAPYHVMLATASGQRRLFERFGLEELEYSVREVAWPAPSRLSLSDLKRPRSVGLFTVRILSQAVSALRPRRWGNRYFYAGRVKSKAEG
ncbi:MAG: class I SAM-dependent methyltransferase [Pyrinomonadaceae bacterium]